MATAPKLLSGKVSLISGASKGIGAVIARRFAENGSKLAIKGLPNEGLHDVASRLREEAGTEVDAYEVDLSIAQKVDEVAQRVLERHGRVDVLVNNAAAFPTDTGLSAAEGDPGKWYRMVAVNLGAPMRFVRHLSPSMLQNREGTIINIGDVEGVRPDPNQAAYAASKHALHGWSSSIYHEFKHKQIKVVCIHPSLTDTEEGALRAPDGPQARISPDDVAEAALLPFRLSPYCVPMDIILGLADPRD
eukprot:jgi/Botrbrau1/7219/Bobra.0021s0004.1